MANIGIIHYKVGGTDGVSLEIEKWQQVLEEMGHVVSLCAGDLGWAKGTLIEELSHYRPESKILYRNTFVALDFYDPGTYAAELSHQADLIEEKLLDFVVDKEIDLLLVHNIWSVAVNPPAALALGRLVRRRQIPTIAHSHDFYWERVDGVALTCAAAVDLADKYLPPRDSIIRHLVINGLAQEELAARKGIASTVVPNVFDFDGPPWQVDDYNGDFRRQAGLAENDIFILQATRIVPRKGIELAIEFVRALNMPERRATLQARGLYDGRPFTGDSRIILVLAGYTVDDWSGRYLGQLQRKIEECGVEARFVEDLVAGTRQMQDGRKIYSLWDTYAHADFVTYPSLWEGWGNQFLEALRAKRPLVLFEYPVYVADIKDKGFRVASLGSELVGRDEHGLALVDQAHIEAAADQSVELLTDGQLRRETVEHNFELGRRHYSPGTLRDIIEKLLAGM